MATTAGTDTPASTADKANDLRPIILLARESCGVSSRSLYRWISEGVRIRGRRVLLEAERRGGRWYSSTAAIDKFLADCRAAIRGPESR